MNYLYGHDRELAHWVGERTGIEDFGPSVAIGLVKGGSIIAAVVYSRYSKTNIEMSIASTTPRWATKKTLEVFFNYPFKQLGLGRVTATTRAGNQHTRAFLERLGFTQEGIIRQGYGDEDAIIFGLLKTECRWIHE